MKDVSVEREREKRECTMLLIDNVVVVLPVSSDTVSDRRSSRLCASLYDLIDCVCRERERERICNRQVHLKSGITDRHISTIFTYLLHVSSFIQYCYLLPHFARTHSHSGKQYNRRVGESFETLTMTDTHKLFSAVPLFLLLAHLSCFPHFCWGTRHDCCFTFLSIASLLLLITCSLWKNILVSVYSSLHRWLWTFSFLLLRNRFCEIVS